MTRQTSFPLSPEQAIPRIRALLDEGIPCHLTVTGNSMRPFLRHQRDGVILAPVSGELRRGDILFYLRAPNAPILHRVQRAEADRLIMCGDAQTGLEPIARAQVLGVVSHIKREGKVIPCTDLRLRLLVALWMLLKPVRPYLLALPNKLKR